MKRLVPWLPAAALALGCVLVLGIRSPRDMHLTGSLSSLPRTLMGNAAEDVVLSPEELAANGATTYAYRSFKLPDGTERFSLYAGYYASQRQGRTIHSPKNCLPGSGWEPLAATIITVGTSAGAVPVNRYVLANGGHRALVYYWYQGRGRVEADEYRVKFQLLRDAAFRGRSEEALLRVVVPLRNGVTEADADAIAQGVAGAVVPAMDAVLPPLGTDS
jgi:EpsI family protein